MAFSRALCFNEKVTPSATIWKWDKDEPHKKNMRWISILVAACIISMYSSIGVCGNN